MDPRRVQQEADREREDADDERVARAPLPPARRLRRVLDVTPAEALGGGASGARAVAGALDRCRLVVGQRGQRGEGAVGHQNWK